MKKINIKRNSGGAKKAVLGVMLDGTTNNNAINIGSSPIGEAFAFGIPYEQFNRHIVVIGKTGSGKTVTQLRLMSTLMALFSANQNAPQIRVIYVDAKGRSANQFSGIGDLQEKIVSIAQHHGYRNINCFPEQSMDGFTGDPLKVIERISALFEHGESAFHHAEATVMLGLAYFAGNYPKTLEELVGRLKPSVCESIYMSMGTPDCLVKAQECKSFNSSQWNSVYLRMKAILLRVGNSFDITQDCFSFRTTDCAYISINGTTAPQASGEIATWLLKMLAEIAEYNDGRKTVIFLDEFSAIGDDDRAVKLVAGLVERVRSSGISLIIGTQTTSTLGEKAERIMGTAGTLITHQNGNPEDIIKYAGTESVFEDTYQTDGVGQKIKTSGRLQSQFSINPDEVRKLPVGECFVISEGKWARVCVQEPN